MAKKCPNWPRCQCIVQGYVNRYEHNDCGKKPSSDIERDRRTAIRRFDSEMMATPWGKAVGWKKTRFGVAREKC